MCVSGSRSQNQREFSEWQRWAFSQMSIKQRTQGTEDNTHGNTQM